MVRLQTLLCALGSSSSRPGKFEHPMTRKKNVRRLAMENCTMQSVAKRKRNKARPQATEKRRRAAEKSARNTTMAQESGVVRRSGGNGVRMIQVAVAAPHSRR